MKTWHAAIASFGTAAFLVAAYIAVLSVSGALFALTDLSHVGTTAPPPKLKTVVAAKSAKAKPVVARAPRPEPAPEPPTLEPKPAQAVASTNLVQDLPSSHSSSQAPAKPTEATGKPNFQNPGNGSGTGDTGGEPRDDAALISADGVNVSGPAKNLTDKVNTGLERTAGLDLHRVTDPVVKVVDGLERHLGLDRQGR